MSPKLNLVLTLMVTGSWPLSILISTHKPFSIFSIPVQMRKWPTSFGGPAHHIDIRISSVCTVCIITVSQTVVQKACTTTFTQEWVTCSMQLFKLWVCFFFLLSLSKFLWQLQIIGKIDLCEIDILGAWRYMYMDTKAFQIEIIFDLNIKRIALSSLPPSVREETL